MGLFGGRKKDMIDGTAQVLAVSKPIQRARYVNCKLDLVVQAPGVAPFQAAAKKNALRWTRVPQVGMTIPVRVSPTDPGDFEVCWDDLPDHDQLIAQRAQQVIDGAPAVTLEFADQAEPAPSRIEQLERLAALHASGALDDDEFAAEKARILGS